MFHHQNLPKKCKIKYADNKRSKWWLECFPPSFKVSQLSLELWPGEGRLQTSRTPESLQDNKDFRWELVSEYEMQNFAMLAGYSGRIVVNYLPHLFFCTISSLVVVRSWHKFHPIPSKTGGIILPLAFVRIWLAERFQQRENLTLYQSGLLFSQLLHSWQIWVLGRPSTDFELRNHSVSWTYKAYLGTQRRAWRFIDTDYGRL